MNRYLIATLYSFLCVAAICAASGVEQGKQTDYFKRVAGQK